MFKIILIIKLLFFILILNIQNSNAQYEAGNLSSLELGDAIYRTGGTKHGHNGVFSGLIKKGDKFYFSITHTAGGKSSGSADQGKNEIMKTNFFNISVSDPSLDDKIGELITKFESSYTYKGAFTNPAISPTKRKKVISTARTICFNHPGYTFLDMIDIVGILNSPIYREEWHGIIDEIDEIRCDGYTEFSYEKNAIPVANDMIAEPGLCAVYNHNNLHKVWDYYDAGCYDPELCPMIQANLTINGHSDDLTGSTMEPSIVEIPYSSFPVVTSNNIMRFTYEIVYEETCYEVEINGEPDERCAVEEVWEATAQGYEPGVQLSFQVSDNASVQSFVLVQAKLPSESTWHTIIDNDNPDLNKWEYRTVDLTEYDGSLQSGNIFIQWLGVTDGGPTYTQADMMQCMFRVVAIDQGGNISEEPKPAPPIIPQNFQASQYNNSPRITWTANSEKYIKHYEIWKRYEDWSSNNSGWYYLTTTATNSYIDYSEQMYDNATPPRNVYYKIRAVDSYGGFSGFTAEQHVYCNPENSGYSISDASFAVQLPTETELIGNFPNPFNINTTIKYALPEMNQINLSIYNLRGQLVSNLVNQYQEAGYYQLNYNASALSSGLYIYKLTVGNFTSIKRMLLIK